jgi:competence protein ComEC
MFFIAYALGIVFCVYFNFIHLLIAAILYAIVNSIISKKLIPNVLIILVVLLSFITVSYNSKSILAQYIDNNNEEIITKIINIQSNNEESKYTGYNAEIISVNGRAIKEKTIIYILKETNVDVNSIVKFNASISEISSNKNRMLFNYKDSLRAKGIFVNVFCKGDIELVKRNYSAFNSLSNFCIEKTEILFRKYMSEDNANTVLSVILGDVKYLDKDYYKDIQKTGLAHIFAVSGAHIVIIYAAFFKLFNFFGLKRKISWLLSWTLLWIYGFIIGFPITVLRSLLMFNFLFGSEVIYRKYNSINSLVISAFILLILNPYYLFDVGFQLSYMAALCLLVNNCIIKKKSDNKSTKDVQDRNSNSLRESLTNLKNNILENLWVYVFVQAFTLPIMSYYFNYVSIIGIIFNLLIVPLFDKIILFSLLVIPINFISPNTIILPLKLLDYILNALDYLIDIGSKLDITGLEISSMTALSGIYYYIFLATILYFISFDSLQFKKLIFSAISLFYIIDFIVVPMKYNGLNINIIDVGQGMFMNINYKGYNLIFDVGSKSPNIGKYVAVPYLTKHGIKNIDAVFISHIHEDHYNGLNMLLEDSNIKSIFASNKNDENSINSEYSKLNTNQAFNLEDRFSLNKIFKTPEKAKKNVSNLSNNLKIKVLWPDKGYFSENENNMSNVYLLQFENVKILITGDIEKEVEEIILDRLVDVDIVIVPHHGSNTSSTQDFINKIKPEIAIFSYGKNTYGIPSQLVIDRYKEAGSEVLATFIDGEINIMVNKDKIYYNTYTGNYSTSMNEIYNYNAILNLQAFIAIILITCFGRKYVKDKTVEWRLYI